MQSLKKPQFWLMVWGVIGALGLVYVIIAASVKQGGASAPSARDLDPALLVGEMEDFQYAFPPRRAPDILFQHEGKPTSLADFRGKAILVNFWATWCAPCLKELPSLDALQQELGGRRFEVVAIAADPRGPEAAQTFLDRLEIDNLALYADPDLSAATAMGAVNVLPVSILYDARGQEIGRLVGEADWISPEAVALVGSTIP